MKDDMYLDYRRRPGRRKKKWVGGLLLILGVAVVGVLGYFAVRLYFNINDSLSETVASSDDNASDENLSNEAASDMGLADAGFPSSDTENMLAAWNSYDSATSDDAGDSSALNGIYGLWTEKKEEPKEEEDPYAEEIWMGDFVDNRKRVDAKGIYVSSASINKKLDEAIELIDSTELNAMVIDIKSDAGYITYQMDYQVAKDIGACTSTIGDIGAMVKKLKEHDIYLIARVVTLKDPILAEKKPELALRNKDGSIFRDSSGLAWVNPYEEEVWDYLLEVCKQCVEVGFDEVNLDYIRFSTDKGMSEVDFGPEAENKTRIDVISEGIKRLCEEIKPMGAFISCDVYGAIISSSVDAKIVGQSYFKMGSYLDYICPMVYPSHYGDGYYNLDYPDCHPYDLVYHALMDSQKVLYMLDPKENKAEVRPWLQDFTATWVKHHLEYGKEEVRGQINAVYDAGYSQWLLWNAGVTYTEEALLRE